MSKVPSVSRLILQMLTSSVLTILITAGRVFIFTLLYLSSHASKVSHLH